MRPVPEREAAKAAGDQFYETGRLCKNGHLAKRSTRSGLCVECDRERNARWHEARPGIATKWARERRAKNPEPHRESSKKWAKKNPESVRASTKRTYARNPEYWRRKQVGYTQNHNARKKANGGEFTEADIAVLYEEQGGKCAGCFKHKKLETDHVVAVSRGGVNAPPNLQLLCRSCNASKADKVMTDWLHEVFQSYLSEIK